MAAANKGIYSFCLVILLLFACARLTNRFLVADGTTITAPLNLHLATNIKTTQSLLNALAKIPANSNATPAMRNLARVLASPLRPQGRYGLCGLGLCLIAVEQVCGWVVFFNVGSCYC